jgi:hypothetical protein
MAIGIFHKMVYYHDQPTSVHLSMCMILKANEETEEVGLAARSAPQMEATSILALDNADAHWRV